MTPGEMRGALLILFVIVTSMLAGIYFGQQHPIVQFDSHHIARCMCSFRHVRVRLNLWLSSGVCLQAISTIQMHPGRLGLATACF